MSDDLVRRAIAAYFRAVKADGGLPIIPGNYSGVATHNGKQYVVLRSGRGVVAVYRVRNDGMLKGLKRWPREIEAY